MVREILTKAGLVENETFRETRFLRPPNTSYAVFNDSIERGGGDLKALLKHHSVSIELYEYTPDPILEGNVEAQLDEYYALMLDGWTKQERYWLEEEQLYQVIYEFDYIEK